MADPVTEDGWHIWDMTAERTWPSVWPPVHYRLERPGLMAVRAWTHPQAGNLHGNIHGAFLAGLAEHVVGVFVRAAGIPSVTVSVALDYPDAGLVDRPLTGTVELMRETGRLQFTRVTIEQEDAIVIHGMATLRKFQK